MPLQHCQLSSTCMYKKGLVIGMIISQGGGGPDEVKLGAIIQTPPIIQTTPISFLQRLVLHIAHVLSQLGMIIQTYVNDKSLKKRHGAFLFSNALSCTCVHCTIMCYFDSSIPISCCGYNNLKIISWAIVLSDPNVITYLAIINREMQDLSRSDWEFETGQTKQY